MKVKARKTEIETPEDRALDASIELIYRKYGNDLRAFMRDLHQELATKRQDAENTAIATERGSRF